MGATTHATAQDAGCHACAARENGTYASEPERLVETYADLILRLSYTYLGSTHDAEDICQTVFLRLLERPRSFESAEHERAWVIRVTANLCRDLLKSSVRRTSVSLDSAPEPSTTRTPEKDLVASSSNKRLLVAISQLPDIYRETIYLHYYEDYPTSQIARLTSCTEAAVAQRLSRGRAKLREILEGDRS